MGLLVFVALVLCGLALFVAFVYVVCWFPWVWVSVGLIYYGYCCLLGRLMYIVTADRMRCGCGNWGGLLVFCCGLL